jgi:FMN-dependent dehydrogenase
VRTSRACWPRAPWACSRGRAFIYGVGALGRAGAEHTIDILREELTRFMGQLRCARPEQLARYLPDYEERAAGEQPMRAHAWG